VPIPPLDQLRRMYEALLAPLKPAACVAVALNTQRLSEEQARAAIVTAQRETGLPVDDVVRYGGRRLWGAVRTAAQATPKAQSRRKLAQA
jgi:uncharacterized NAD-dependent epimerase/dehydratase family protein